MSGAGRLSGYIVGLITGIVISFIAVDAANDVWRKRMIEAGCAQYDSQTGAFERSKEKVK